MKKKRLRKRLRRMEAQLARLYELLVQLVSREKLENDRKKLAGTP